MFWVAIFSLWTSASCITLEGGGEYSDATIAEFVRAGKAAAGARYDQNRGNHEFYFAPTQPLQGFKLHISFPKGQAMGVMRAVLPVLLSIRATHKFPTQGTFDRYYGNPADAQNGKLITVYPDDLKHLGVIVHALKEPLSKFSDFQEIKGDHCAMPGIFARYGRIMTTHEELLNNDERVRVDQDGFAVGRTGQQIADPNGQGMIHLSGLVIHDPHQWSRAGELRKSLMRAGAIERDVKTFKPDWMPIDPFAQP